MSLFGPPPSKQQAGRYSMKRWRPAVRKNWLICKPRFQLLGQLLTRSTTPGLSTSHICIQPNSVRCSCIHVMCLLQASPQQQLVCRQHAALPALLFSNLMSVALSQHPALHLKHQAIGIFLQTSMSTVTQTSSHRMRYHGQASLIPALSRPPSLSAHASLSL